MDRFEELMKEYESRFDDTFPTMCFQMDSLDELIVKIQKCLDSGLPAEEVFQIRDDVLY